MANVLQLACSNKELEMWKCFALPKSCVRNASGSNGDLGLLVTKHTFKSVGDYMCRDLTELYLPRSVVQTSLLEVCLITDVFTHQLSRPSLLQIYQCSYASIATAYFLSLANVRISLSTRQADGYAK